MKNTTITFLLLFICTIFNGQKEKAAPEFLDMYITNSANERIDSADLSDVYIYIVVVTRNGNGEKATLSLKEDDDNFIYKNNFIGPGDQFQFKVNKDLIKLKFEIFDYSNKKHLRLKRKAEKKKEKIEKEHTE